MATMSTARRLLCIDLDGTLFNSQHRVSSANAAAVVRAVSAGWELAICTGRGPTMYMPTAEELGLTSIDSYNGHHLVGYNGAIVYRLDANGRNGRTLFEASLTEQQISSLVSMGDGCAMEFDVGQRQFALCSDSEEQRSLLRDHAALCASHPEVVSRLPSLTGVNKITILHRDPAAFLAAHAGASAALESERVGLVAGGPYWLETAIIGQDKAAGVQLVCKDLEMGLSDCIAFGDSGNDVTMLAACGESVAMGQARDEAKSAAKRVSKWTNDEDAVAREIAALLDRR